MGLLKRQTIMSDNQELTRQSLNPAVHTQYGAGQTFASSNHTSFARTAGKGGLLKGGSYSTFMATNESVQEPKSEKLADGIMELEEENPSVALDGTATSVSSSSAAPPSVPHIDRLLIEEAEKKAADIVKKARAEAKKLIEETKLYSQSAFSQAEADGFSKGKEEGFEAGKEEMTNLILEARDVLSQVLKERELLLRSIEPEVAKLSVRIAEKIMRYQIDIDQNAVVNMIRSALETIKQREEVIIKVNQEDYYYAKEKKSLFASMVEGLKTMDIVVDSSVDRGGCIIETNLGNVDARISTQIHTLELVFDKVAEQRASEYESAEQ